MTKPHVLIGLPTMSSMHPWLTVNILAWMATAFKTGKYNMSIYPTFSVQPVDNARNQIVDAFLKSDATHLFFIDSDTIPPVEALEKLLAHDKDIVSAITPIIQHDEKTDQFFRVWNCVDLNDKHVQPFSGILQVKGAGASCILIKREVFEQIEKPYFRFLYEDDNGKSICFSEDLHFIAKALSKGIKTYADTNIICKHHKSTTW